MEPHKKDITNRADIEQLVNAFYTQVKTDDVIGHIFTKVVPLVWEVHMPIMYEFWDSVLFQAGNYRGNPMRKHVALDQKIPLTDEHFARWKKLFFQTLDEHFAGPNTEVARARVGMIEEVMKAKIAANRSAQE